MEATSYTSYHVWDRTVRWFHWINVLSVLGLLGSGLVIYNGKALGISAEAKVFMKQFHVWFGYVMAVNLLWRILWGFFGNRFSRWSAILPFGRGYLAELRAYLKSLRSGEPRYYLGHNPLGRLMVAALLLLLILQAVTGLVLAGTDLYWPPLGSWIAEWVAPAGVDPSTLLPGDKAMADAAAWDAMRSFRKPYITLHELVFFVLSAAIVVHIAAV
ncbi:MAG: cytochrome b/b6 domain-containing protein, partial [Anaerolineae bacterium]|nr:cytochrome b/b6 domain-containing protein [Anaerolineae bacterium]